MGVDLRVRVRANSSCEEVLGFKCCSLQGMNLELTVVNQGDKTVSVLSKAEFIGPSGRARVDYFFPHGAHRLLPDEGISLYCSFDENRFKEFSRVVIEDEQGRRYEAALSGELEPARPLSEERQGEAGWNEKRPRP